MRVHCGAAAEPHPPPERPASPSPAIAHAGRQPAQLVPRQRAPLHRVDAHPELGQRARPLARQPRAPRRPERLQEVVQHLRLTSNTAGGRPTAAADVQHRRRTSNSCGGQLLRTSNSCGERPTAAVDVQHLWRDRPTQATGRHPKRILRSNRAAPQRWEGAPPPGFTCTAAGESGAYSICSLSPFSACTCSCCSGC
eukprot:5926886-Prymnesium_polylepis.1